MKRLVPVDVALLDQARRAGLHRDARSTVAAALQKCVRFRLQLAIIDLFGTIDFDPSYDYKRDRERR